MDVEQVTPREASGSGEVGRAKLFAFVKAVHVALCSGEDREEEKEQDRRDHVQQHAPLDTARGRGPQRSDDHGEQSNGDHDAEPPGKPRVVMHGSVRRHGHFRSGRDPREPQDGQRSERGVHRGKRRCQVGSAKRACGCGHGCDQGDHQSVAGGGDGENDPAVVLPAAADRRLEADRQADQENRAGARREAHAVAACSRRALVEQLDQPEWLCRARRDGAPEDEVEAERQERKETRDEPVRPEVALDVEIRRLRIADDVGPHVQRMWKLRPDERADGGRKCGRAE